MKKRLILILIILVIASSFGYAFFSPFTSNEKKDSDGDGIPDIYEKYLGLNPYKKDSVEDLMNKLKELNSMLINGTISISEYNKMKRILLFYINKLNRTWSK